MSKICFIRLCLWWVSMAAICDIWAQRMPIQVLTTKEGMIGNELSSVLYDTSGKIWVSSYGSGISLYNGQSFNNFSQNRTPYFSPGHIESDNQGHINIFDYNARGFARCVGDSLVTYLVPDGKAVFIHNKEKRIYLVDLHNTIFQFNESSLQFETLLSIPKHTEGVVQNIEYNAETRLYELLIWNHKKRVLYKIATDGQQTQTIFRFKNIPFLRFFKTELLGLVYFTQQGIFYLKNNKKIPLSYPHLQYQSRYSANDDQYYYFHKESSEGVHHVFAASKKDLSLKAEYKFYHPSKIVDIAMDKSGTLWCATFYGLVRVFPQLMECKVGDKNMLSDLHVISEDKKGNIWFGTYGYGFCYFDGQKIQPSPPILRGVKNVLPGSVTDSDGNMYFSTEQEQTIYTDGFSVKKTLTQNLGYYFTHTNNGSIAFGQFNYQGILIKEKSGQTFQVDSSKGLKLVNIITLVQDNAHRFWMGRGSQGIAVYLPDKDTVLNWLRVNGNDFGLWSSEKDSRGNLWFGTINGLAFYSPPAGEVSLPPNFSAFRDFKMIGADIFKNQTLTFLKNYNNQYLAIGSQEKGLFLLDLEHFYNGHQHQPRIFQFPLKDNMVNSGTEQNAVWIDKKGYLWSGHDQGAVRIDLTSWVFDTLAPRVKISRIESGLATHQPTDNILALAPEEHSLKIYLEKDLTPYFYDNISFKYRLNQDSFKILQGNMIELSYLNNQKHILEVVAIKNGLQYPLPLLVFDVKPYFWKTVWFWAILFSIATFIGYRFFKARQLVLKKDNDLKAKSLALEKNEREKNQLQVQALVNQLNPHFINNALMWTQLRMMKDDESVNIISKLNYNISTVFRNSLKGKSYHSLKDELNIVSNYLYIQNKRFDGAIDYILPSEESVKTWGHINVLLMQIQIHCENAVEHGIRNLPDGKGVLKIEIFDDNDYLRITIEDNGIGRKAAAALHSKGTQQGTKMLDNLCRIFNKNNQQPLVFQYEDDIFTDKNGKSLGTRVILKIPKTYQYELLSH